MMGHLFRGSLIGILVTLAPPVWAAPLHDAVATGDAAAVEQLIGAGAKLETLDENGETPLTAAALEGQQEIVQLLIDRGAQLNGRNDGGFTALHAAAYVGAKGTVELLLDRGADINDDNNKSRMAPLHTAAEEGHAEIAALLVERGAHIDLKEMNGLTPIALATFKRFPDVVTVLRQLGATCPRQGCIGDQHFNFCENPKG